MVEQILKSKRIIDDLKVGPLKDHLDDLIRRMREKGFPDEYILARFGAVNALNQWLALRQFTPIDLNERRVAEFLDHRAKFRTTMGHNVILRELIGLLREKGAAPIPAPEEIHCPIERLLLDYSEYLLRDRGVNEASVRRRNYYARMFLGESFAGRPVQWDQLKASDITEFTKRHIKDIGISETTHMTTYLRTFLRYMLATGRINTDLAKAVPSPARWRETKLPLMLKDHEVRMLLESCDRSVKKGKRDYAVLMLLSRLGMRGGEVNNLKLDDINWPLAEISIVSKGKESKLPLPQDVGDAIVDYIRNARPKSPSRHIFLKTTPPYKQSRIASAIVKSALGRAKLNPPKKGAHLLRHTVANQCLSKGASLEEIAFLLRHKHINTVGIYAKVDFNRLRSIAQPWPMLIGSTGGAR